MADSFRKAWYHLQMAKEYFDDVVRSHPDTVGGRKSKLYSAKIAWMNNDFITTPFMPVREMQQFKKEMQGDIMFPMAIAEKVLQLTDETKDILENIVDLLLQGETIQIERVPDNETVNA